MNFRFSLLIIFGVIINANVLYANECSSVQFSNNLKEEQVVELVAVDAQLLDFVNNYNFHKARRIDKGTYSHYFKPGNYSLLLRVWDRNFFRTIFNIDKSNLVLKYKQGLRAYSENRLKGNLHSKNSKYLKNERIINQFIKEIPVEISIGANKSYQYTLKTENENYGFTQTITSRENCQNESAEIFEKEALKQKYVQELPSYLQNKLYELVDKISLHQQSEYGTPNNVIPMGELQIFGAVFNPKIDNNKGVQVLSVFPGSLANKVGLVSGDIVKKVGGSTLSLNSANNTQHITDYIGSVEKGDEFSFNVLRDGKEVALEHTFVPLVVPQSTILIETKKLSHKNSLVKNSPLPELLQFEYDLLLLKLSEQWSDDLEDNNIELISDPFVARKYGIIGKLTDKSLSASLLVTRIENHSTAHAMGIKVGDKIQTINEAPIEHLARPFSRAISKLENGQLHKVKLMREDQLITLSGNAMFREYQQIKIKLLSVTKMASLNYRSKKLRGPHRFTHNSSSGTLHSSPPDHYGGTKNQ